LRSLLFRNPRFHVNEQRRANGESNQNSRSGRGTRRGLTPLSSKVSSRSGARAYTAWDLYTPAGKEQWGRKTQIQHAPDRPEPIQPRQGPNQVPRGHLNKAFSYRTPLA